ncbi:MAG: protein translocase subunit SecD [Planctomycetota bacterium]
MVDNLNRKLTLIFGFLAAAVIALSLLNFRLGLDLQGGTRLTYTVDLDQARAAGQIQQTQTDDAAISNVIGIWRKRLDPDGVRDVKLRKSGRQRILIELPGNLSLVAQKASSTLSEAYVPGGESENLTLDPNNPSFKDFPGGGRIVIDGEQIRYKRKIGNRLGRLEWSEGSTPRELPAGTEVVLEASDPWRALIENTGRMEVLMHATTLDAAGTFDLNVESDKAATWARENPNASISEYNSQLAAENPDQPLGRLRFFPQRLKADNLDVPVADRLTALIVEQNTDFLFSGSDFPRVFPSYDELGAPAVGFEIATDRQNDFFAFTKEHEGEQMAIVIDNEIATDPQLNDPLRSGGIITGGSFGFTQAEVDDLVQVINSGSLDLEPQFEDRETVGASLGAEYVRLGLYSILVGLGAVLIFIAWYYKRLGLFAALSLIFNLVLLMGAMAMLQATLTLPGVAGIILTVGMAVDANILIYERIREEALRGRRPAQSAKDGFANATSTIVDANLTTLITAIILYQFGSGPVQGFATTLSVGILTSMFSALIFTRVLVHFAVERGVDEWKMVRLVKEHNIGFMALSKKTAVVSAILIVAGVAAFASISPVSKYSIDFLGGNSMQLVTAKPEKQETVKTAISGLGEVFEDASVQPLLSSAEGDGYLKFQVEFKSDGTQGDRDLTSQYRERVESGLSEMLAPNRFTFDSTGEGGASGTIYFEGLHSATDVATALTGAALGDVSAEAAEGSADAARAFKFTATSTDAEAAIGQRIVEAFATAEDSGGRAFTLAQPIPRSEAVGPQVVQELRDDAILAILLSLFAVVMYIRVRFAEYSFGFAAVIALVHDVLVTLGFLALAIGSGLINAQISLVMIAAFLTIIGYSLNDTIVVFDRIRENRPRMKGSLREVIDRSINQTLARTILTSVTTLLAVLILFLFNVGTRNDLEGFAFAVIVGVLVGTYSSMFVASPSLLLLETRREAKLAELAAKESDTKEPAAAAS